MNWTYADLKLALDALGDVSDSAAVDALAAQTEVITPVDVDTADARQVLLESGEWGGLIMLAASTPSATLPAAVIGAAIVARDTLMLTRTMRTSDDTVWTKIQTLLGALGTQGAGIISDATIATLSALRSKVVNKWVPAPNAGDIQTARPAGIAAAAPASADETAVLADTAASTDPAPAPDPVPPAAPSP